MCIDGDYSDAYYEMKAQRDALAEDNAMLKVKINAMREDAFAISPQSALTGFLTLYPKETI